MRVKVELHPDVAWDLKHVYHPDMAEAFFEALGRLRGDPHGRSMPIEDGVTTPFVLRAFAFGPNQTELAVFQYNARRKLIWGTACESRKPPYEKPPLKRRPGGRS